jgi:hypothetical protein
MSKREFVRANIALATEAVTSLVSTDNDAMKALQRGFA